MEAKKGRTWKYFKLIISFLQNKSTHHYEKRHVVLVILANIFVNVNHKLIISLCQVKRKAFGLIEIN